MNWVSISSSNVLSSGRPQAITTWTSVDLSSTGSLGTSFSEIWIERKFSFKRMRFKKTNLKMSAMFRPQCLHDDVIKWKHFPRYWPFVRVIHRLPVNSPHKGQWRGALMLSLTCTRINGWVNNCEAGDMRRHRAHYDEIVMKGLLRKLSNSGHVNICIRLVH